MEIRQELALEITISGQSDQNMLRRPLSEPRRGK